MSVPDLLPDKTCFHKACEFIIGHHSLDIRTNYSIDSVNSLIAGCTVQVDLAL